MNFNPEALIFLFLYQSMKRLKHFIKNGKQIKHLSNDFNGLTSSIKIKELKCLNILATELVMTDLYFYKKHIFQRTFLTNGTIISMDRNFFFTRCNNLVFLETKILNIKK